MTGDIDALVELAKPLGEFREDRAREFLDALVTRGEVIDKLITLIRAERLEVAHQNHEIEQILGRALGYPKLPEDWSTEDVGVGDHDAVSLAMEAASRIKVLEGRG